MAMARSDADDQRTDCVVNGEFQTGDAYASHNHQHHQRRPERIGNTSRDAAKQRDHSGGHAIA